MPKHFAAWMKAEKTPDYPTPLPYQRSFMQEFLTAEGDPDEQAQRRLAKEMGFGYRNGIGELIYAMITCRPDLSYAVVSLSQYSLCPAPVHYHGVRHMLKYLWYTRNDGLYFWRPEPRTDLPEVEPPDIASREHDILLDGRPSYGPCELHGNMGSDWATCPKTRRSMGGGGLRLAGGT